MDKMVPFEVFSIHDPWQHPLHKEASLSSQEAKDDLENQRDSKLQKVGK